MNRLLAAAVVCAVTTGAGVANAAPLEGKFRIDGVGDVRVGADFVDFFPFFPVTTGRFEVTTATELAPPHLPGGSFTVVAGTEGTIKDLVSVPVGAPVSISQFLTFDARPAWNFTLTELEAGAADNAECFAPAAAGQECTPPGSPFTLFNLSSTRSIVALAVKGVAENELGELSNFTGVFTSQLDTMSYQMALAQIAVSGPDDELNYVQSSWSAEFTVEGEDDTNVPEPASMALMGLALSGMAVALRRRRS